MAKRIDFHVHSEFSNDSQLKLERILDKAKKQDFYIAIADHNEIAGYLKSQKLPEKDRVIPAIEAASSEGVHILLYFTNKKSLIQFYENVVKKHKTKDLFWLNIPALTIIKEGKKHGAVVGAAHPFAKTVGLLNNTKINNPTKYLELVHLYEIYNGALIKSMNNKASKYHKENCENKPVTAGSDGHFIEEIGNVLLEVEDFNSFEQLFNNLTGKNKTIGNPKFKVLPAIKKELILTQKSKKIDYLKCRASRVINFILRRSG